MAGVTAIGPTFEDVRRALAGSQGGFAALDRRFRPRLEVWVAHLRTNPARFGLRWRRHIQGDDVVQEALRRAYAGLQGLRDPAPGSFWNWLKHITRNTVIDLMRRVGEHVTDVEVGSQGEEDAAGPETRAAGREPAPATRLLAQDLRQRLGAALAALEPRDAQVVELCFLSGLTLAEVAALLGIKVTRVHQLKVRALRNLRAQLAGEESLLNVLGGA